MKKLPSASQFCLLLGWLNNDYMKKLYLDDERNPHPSHGWTVVRNYAEFVEYIVTKGIPDVISFDHDLGENHYKLQGEQWSLYPELVEQGEVDLSIFGETGYDIAKWLTGYSRDMDLDMCDVYVHSMNTVGSQNIAFEINKYYQERNQAKRVKKGDLCLNPK